MARPLGVRGILDDRHRFEVHPDGRTMLVHHERLAGMLVPMFQTMLTQSTPAAFVASTRRSRPAFFDSRYQLATDLIERATAAGDLRSDVDPKLVWEAMVNPLHLRAITGRPADDATARALVALVLAGARAG